METDSYWRRVAHRWFVEFNPLYLVSAAIVLAGCFLLSRGLARSDSAWAPVGITLVSETYAFALAGGAALLVRLGERRPATMLALLFVLYEWDLTMHTETCAILGRAGPWAAAAWLAVFGAKIRVLAWALRVRVARRLVAAWLVGAAGLALGPLVVLGAGGRAAGAFVAAWLFAFGASHRAGGVESVDDLGAWGRTVVARATRAAWGIAAVLMVTHVLFWAADHAIDLATLGVVPPLLAARAARSERRAWGLVLGTTALVVVAMPAATAITAVLAGAALVARAFAPVVGDAETAVAEAPPARAPYRSIDADAADVAPGPAVVGVAAVDPAERTRAVVAAIFAAYVAGWTLGWTHGPWPHHVLALDAALGVAVLVAAWRLRTRLAFAPLVACYAHAVIDAGLVPPPRTTAQWGGVLVAMGFALLGGSLAASLRLSRRAPRGGGAIT